MARKVRKITLADASRSSHTGRFGRGVTLHGRHGTVGNVIGGDANKPVQTGSGPRVEVNLVRAGRQEQARTADARGRFLLALVGRLDNASLEALENWYGSMDLVADHVVTMLPTADLLDETVGPFRTVANVQGYLGLNSRQAVHARIDAGALLAVKSADGKLLLPDFQFTDQQQGLPRLRDVLEAFGGPRGDTWAAALWLAQPDRDLDGSTPAEAIRGADPDFVVELARRAGSVLAS